MAMRTIGVEEEYLLLSPDGVPYAVAAAALQHAHAGAGPTEHGSGPGGDLEKEFKQEQIETSTHPVTTLDDLADGVRTGRVRAQASAAHTGARIAALGTSPVWVDSTVIDDRRAREIRTEFGETAREQLTCGCHVHVSVESPAEGVVVLDHLRRWTPVLLALSANSPFWHGFDSGYRSFRSQVWGRWPTAGPQEPFGDEAGYHAVVEDLLASGTILDPGMLYFDARLSARYPTVEVRAADVCLDVEDAVLQAALVRALADTAVADDTPPLPQPRIAHLRVATWRAARSGLTGELLSPLTGRPVPAAEVVGQLLEHVGAALDRTGDRDRVEQRLSELLASGTGADRQLEWFAADADLAGVARAAADRTLA